MINERSLTAVSSSRFLGRFRKPLYESYCFANLCGTIERSLCGGTTRRCLPSDVLYGLPEQYDKVVLLFLDSFGWKLFERFHDSVPLLRDFERDGVVSQLTAQFPSTTAAHVTMIHSGLPPALSEVFEWYYYEPQLQEIINPLLYSFMRDCSSDGHVRETLAAAAVEPQRILPSNNFYIDLGKRGVRSHIFQSRDYTPSSYSDYLFRKAVVHPFTDTRDACRQLMEAINLEESPTYFFLYLDPIDGVSHRHGPLSDETARTVRQVFAELQQGLHERLHSEAAGTLLLLVADHGQMSIRPDTTWYIDRHLPDFFRFLRSGGSGDILMPAGSSRDLFLHLDADFCEEAGEKLRTNLRDRARVLSSSELLYEGFFGSAEVSESFRQKIGDLIVLPYENESVWWYGSGRLRNLFYGQHGGLSAEEMDIPLIAYAY